MIMTTESAVLAALDGKKEGYTWLYEKYYPENFQIALTLMKNEEDAEDILHDSFLKAFMKLNTLKKPSLFPAWFRKILTNTAKDAHKKQRTVSLETILYDYYDEEGFEYANEIEDESAYWQPELALKQKLLENDFLEKLKNLPKDQRICVELFYVHDMPIKEIAKKLNCPETTVRSRRRYARNKLKHILNGQEDN